MSGRKIDDEFLADVARQYTEHVTAGRMPAPAIAETENTNVRNVHRWVYQARKGGLLPPGAPPGLCGGKIDPKPLGSAGQQVAANVRLLRTARRMSLRALAAALREAGHPLSADALNKIENGRPVAPGAEVPKQGRRVDVDDLVALASVFGVDPASLWAPPAECETCHGAPPPGFICAACSGLTNSPV